MTRRYFIQLSYQGTGYHGWQIQPNAVSVQEVLEDCLSKILKQKTKLTGAGRTDSGVHADNYVAHFNCEECADDRLNSLVYHCNGILPSDIVIHSIFPVGPDDHARFSALSRTYEYHISRVKDPFRKDFEHYYRPPLDIDAMNRACEILFKHSDFTSFSKLHSDTETNNCKIYEARWDSINNGNKLVFTIRADRFLRNMVRAITGTLLQVGRARITPDDFNEIIIKKDRSASGPSAPAKGLILVNIEYPEELKRTYS